MRRIPEFALRCIKDQRGALSVEYGLTAALAIALVALLVVSVQSSLAAHFQTKCYSLGSELLPDKI